MWLEIPSWSCPHAPADLQAQPANMHARACLAAPACRLFTLLQTGRMRLDPKGGWKQTEAVQASEEWNDWV